MIDLLVLLGVVQVPLVDPDTIALSVIPTPTYALLRRRSPDAAAFADAFWASVVAVLALIAASACAAGATPTAGTAASMAVTATPEIARLARPPGTLA